MINDIPEIASFAKFILYADDGAIEEVFEQLEIVVSKF